MHYGHKMDSGAAPPVILRLCNALKVIFVDASKTHPLYAMISKNPIVPKRQHVQRNRPARISKPIFRQRA